MINKKMFKPALLSIAVSSALYSGAGIAQDAANSALEDDNTEIIAVTGIRGSLIRAQAVKQDNAGIVEALSAEDIGQLPDSSIAESLARLPGLAGERSGGRTSGISVRGFKEDFTGTTLNGRELIGIGDNRGVEYDLYPSEIMTGATIHKTSDATLMVTGIGGTVDLQTVRPLQAQETLTVNAVYDMTVQASDNPEFDDIGFRVAGSWVGKFMDDTLGVAVAVASTESPTNQRKYGVWGYAADPTSGVVTPTGLDIFAISKELKRDTISTIIQYQPNENLDIVVDYLNIDFEDSGILRGFIEPFASVNVSGSGANNTGTQINANPVLRTDPEITEGDLEIFGLNIEYALNDNWTATVDVASNESTKSYIRAESYAGIGRSGSLVAGQFGQRDFNMSPGGVFFTGISGMDFSDFNSIKLTGPQEWGGGLASEADRFASNVQRADGNGTYSFLNAQDGFINYADFTEELTTAKFSIEGLVDWGLVNKVTFGAYYSDRSKSKDNNGDFATAPTYPFGDGNGVVDGLIPEEYRYGLADLSWAGLGQVVAYDGLAPYNDGTYLRVQAETLEPDRLGDTFTVDEEILTIFGRVDFETEIGDMLLFGNAGLQIIDTDQSSTGFIGIVDSTFAVCQDGNGGIDQACVIEDGASYTNTLPSLNLNLQLDDQQFVRFAASKTISRARIDQMRASGFVKFDQNIELIAIPDTEADVIEYGSPWSKVQGTPTLRPLESNNFDISYENYFSPEGYVSVAVFYKDLVNWTQEGRQLIDFTNDATNNGANYFIPGFHDRIVSVDGTYGPTNIPLQAGDYLAPPRFGTFESFQDGLTGSVTGLELTANVPFGDFVDVLDGFGIAATASFIDSKLDASAEALARDANADRIPGQSDKTYALTAYYEISGWEFRVAGTKRSEFITYERGGSNKIAAAERDGFTIVDAQISYDFAESDYDSLAGLRVSLQGQNLTDVEEESVDANGFVTSRRSFGPRYMLNFNYSFY